MLKKADISWLLIFFLGVFLFPGCSSRTEDKEISEETRAFLGDNAEAILQEDSTVFMPFEVDETDEIQPLEGLGPYGEKPAGAAELENLLTKEDEEKLKNGKFTAAVCFHYIAADWSQLQLKACRAVLKKYGVELIAVTDAQLKIDKQISDYETVIQMKPDLMITLPLDRDAAAPVLRKAVEKGITISFMDTVPTGFTCPDDYVGMVSADNYANGRVAAEILAEHLKGEGKIAILDYKYSMFHANERSKAARDTFKKYPGIEIVAEEKIETPEEAASKTETLLVAHPDLDGMWTVWDSAGMASAAVIENLGRKMAVTTVDLSRDSAYAIASGGTLIGTGAQHPYDQGIAEAIIGLAALVGKTPPSYVNIPGEKVTRESMKRSYIRVFRSEMPKEIKNALK